MSGFGRLTSLDGLTTTATKISKFYNLQWATIRLVSSDGMLFCIPAKVLGHVNRYQHLTKVTAHSRSEIVLKDKDIETASVLHKYLSVLGGRGLHSFRPCRTTGMTKVFDLALKYGDVVGQQTILLIMAAHLDLGCSLCTPAEMLRFGGTWGSEVLIRKAIVKLVEDKRKMDMCGIKDAAADGRLDAEDVRKLPPVAVATIIKALSETLHQEGAELGFESVYDKHMKRLHKDELEEHGSGVSDDGDDGGDGEDGDDGHCIDSD